MTHLQTELTYPAIAAACAMAGSVFDVKSRRIPNFITIPGFLFGLCLHLALGGLGGFLIAASNVKGIADLIALGAIGSELFWPGFGTCFKSNCT